MVNALNPDTDYIRFVSEVKELIRRSQYQALKAVNKELIKLYWDIGRMIVEKQESLGYGKTATIGCRNQFNSDIVISV